MERDLESSKGFPLCRNLEYYLWETRNWKSLWYWIYTTALENSYQIVYSLLHGFFTGMGNFEFCYRNTAALMHVQKFRTHPVDGPVYLQRNSQICNTYTLRKSHFENSFSSVDFTHSVFPKWTRTYYVYASYFQKPPVVRYDILPRIACVNVNVYGFRLRIPEYDPDKFKIRVEGYSV